MKCNEINWNRLKPIEIIAFACALQVFEDAGGLATLVDRAAEARFSLREMPSVDNIACVAPHLYTI